MNWTLDGQTFIANTFIQIFGTKELTAVIALLMLTLVMLFGGVAGDSIFVVILFAGVILLAPALYGGIELFPAGNPYFGILLLLGGFIIGTAIWRMFRNV